LGSAGCGFPEWMVSRLGCGCQGQMSHGERGARTQAVELSLDWTADGGCPYTV